MFAINRNVLKSITSELESKQLSIHEKVFFFLLKALYLLISVCFSENSGDGWSLLSKSCGIEQHFTSQYNFSTFLGIGIRKRAKTKPKQYIFVVQIFYVRLPFSSYPSVQCPFLTNGKKVYERDGVFTLAQLWQFRMMTDVQKQIRNDKFLNSLQFSNILHFLLLIMHCKCKKWREIHQKCHPITFLSVFLASSMILLLFLFKVRAINVCFYWHSIQSDKIRANDFAVWKHWYWIKFSFEYSLILNAYF